MCATKCFEMYLGHKEKAFICLKIYTFQGHLWLDCVLRCAWQYISARFVAHFHLGLG